MALLLIFILSVFTLIICWDFCYKKHRIDVLAASGVTGPRALPVLGSAIEALSLNAESKYSFVIDVCPHRNLCPMGKDLLQYIGACHQRYGKTFRMWIANELQIYTVDVRYFERILSSTTLLQKGDLYVMLRSWLGDGLLLSVGKKWHSRRKCFTPAFHFKVLEHFVQIFDTQSGILVHRLEEFANGQMAIDMFPKICLAALDVITEAAMGVKVNAQLDPEFPYVKALKSVVYIQSNRLLKLSQRFDWLFRLTAPREYRKMVTGIRTLHDFTIDVIEKRRDALERAMSNESYKPHNMADEDTGSKNPMALLDILLQSTIDGKTLSNEDIREEVDTFMFEGDDTTTSGVSHALYCIARHPEVQRKLCTEIEMVIGRDKTSPITMTQLQELKYMECVIKETLRLHPPVPVIGRKTMQDLKLDDIMIPANTSIYLMLYWAHRDPELFPDPESFQPNRFEGEAADEIKRNPFAYTPFSAGPKNCIGQKFAVLEMKTMISKVLRYYELLPLGPSVEPMMNFILRSPHGVNVGLRPRL